MAKTAWTYSMNLAKKKFAITRSGYVYVLSMCMHNRSFIIAI